MDQCATESAFHFLQEIGPDDFTQLLFQDSLATISSGSEEIGEFTVNIESAGDDCFLVHANSRGLIDNVPCGASIRAYVSHKLETIEQQYHEYAQLDSHPVDKRTTIEKHGEEYVIRRTITKSGGSSTSQSNFPASGFVSEGSNLLLQRLMIKKGLPENFQVTSLDSDGNLCAVSYKSCGEQTVTVEDTELPVIGLERTLHSRSESPAVWRSYYTKNGYLASRSQIGSGVTMKLLAIPPSYQEDEDQKPTFGKKELEWEKDLQMYSKFLDRKEELMNDHGVYMRKHPEIKALLADFLQFLLLRKPENSLAFAAEFFSSFSSGSNC